METKEIDGGFKLTILGAARMVTGSCYLIETNKIKFLVDCGIFQAEKFYEDKNYEKFPFNPAEISFVIITHGHLDHTGRLPWLYKQGFRGKIFSTKPTYDFARILLEDAAHILEEKSIKKQEPM